jgi:TonB family protein
MTRTTFVALALLIATALPARAADDPVDEAKRLYLSAAYDAALAALSNLPPSVDLDEVDKYRALCLLGLNRQQDAQEIVQKLVTRRPLAKLDDGDSPKLLAMFKEARARVIPTAARSLYVSAKDNFEKGQVKTAAAQFHDVIALVAEADGASDATLGDVKILAEGFSKLAEQLLAQQTAASNKAAADAAAAHPSEPAPPAPARVFDAAATDVVPPIAISQVMPEWNPPTGFQSKNYTGTLEVVIDEQGVVTGVALVTPVNVTYDQLLLSAAKRWRYRPAQRAGQPVKYRKTIAIVLTPGAREE